MTCDDVIQGEECAELRWEAKAAHQCVSLNENSSLIFF